MPQTLEDAIRLNKPAAAARLLAEGADPNARAGDLWPLHHAAEHGWVELVRALVAGGTDVNLTLDYSGTPLHAAARDPAGAPTIPVLLAHGADPGAVEPRSGSTPLHSAAAVGNVAAAAMLLSAGARINAPDAVKFTPLFRVADAEQREMAHLLLRLGAVLNLDVISLHNDLLRELHWLLTGEQAGGHVVTASELEQRRALLLDRLPAVVVLLPAERWRVTFCWTAALCCGLVRRKRSAGQRAGWRARRARWCFAPVRMTRPASRYWLPTTE